MGGGMAGGGIPGGGYVPQETVLMTRDYAGNGDRVTKTGYEWMDFPSDTTVWDLSSGLK